MSVLVLGSINTDLVIRGPRLPRPGETVLEGEFFQAAGGKGANQAVAAARAGKEQVVFLATVGDDSYGRQSLDGLRREGIDCRWIRVVPNVTTGVALILVDPQGENLISVAGGANLALTPEFVDAVPEEVFASAKVCLASLETPAATVLRFLRRARRAGVPTILNPAPALARQQAEPLLKLADVLTPNEHEVATLAECEADSQGSAVAAAAVLQVAGAKSVVVTLGANGSVVVEQNRPPVAIPAMSVTAVDTTAAGDAFSGALAVGLSEGTSLADAARFATIAAGLAVTKAGAQPSLPSRAEIERAHSANPSPAG